MTFRVGIQALIDKADTFIASHTMDPIVLNDAGYRRLEAAKLHRDTLCDALGGDPSFRFGSPAVTAAIDFCRFHIEP